MAAKTYLVVSNGQWPKEEIWRPLVEDSVHLIACDGAANQCLAQNISMDTVIGDMDSLSKEVKIQLQQQPRLQFIHQENQENNDLVKAINWSVEQGATQIEVIGIEGGDLAHQFAAILALCEIPSNTRLHTTDSIIQLIDNTEYNNSSIEKNTSFSLFAIGTVKGVYLTGAKWNLINQELKPGTQGLHNVVVENCLEIKYSSGRLLLFLDR